MKGINRQVQNLLPQHLIQLHGFLHQFFLVLPNVLLQVFNKLQQLKVLPLNAYPGPHNLHHWPLLGRVFKLYLRVQFKVDQGEGGDFGLVAACLPEHTPQLLIVIQQQSEE